MNNRHMESWGHVQIFHSGDDYFHSLISDIRHAQSSITIEAYIFAVDKLTLTLLEELGHARERGCSVKIVVDGFGSYNYIQNLDRICIQKGIEMRVFNPFPTPLFWMRQRIAKYSTGASFLFSKLNRRTHRKITIVDERAAYLGSFNFTEIHCSSIVGTKAWRDSGARVEGPPVKQLVLAFQISYLRTYVKGLINWVGRWKLKVEPYQKVLRLNTTQRMRRRLYKDLLRRLASAKSRIYITTAYFLPKRALLRAILKSARRGVDIKILIPGKSDVPLVKWAAYYIVRFLIQRNIPIFEYQTSILHAKTMIIDDDVFIGSFNLNHRSLVHDLEVEVVLNDEKSIANMLDQWNKDLANSKLVVENFPQKPSLFLRIIYWIAFRFRYML